MSQSKRLKLLALAGLLGGGAAQAALAVTAQDVFDQVVYELAIGYGGPSPIKASDLRRKYLPELQKSCAGKVVCSPANAYPVVRALLEELGDKHTNFFAPEQLEEVGKLFAGEASSRKSFGMATEALGAGGRVVLEVLPDSPAKQAGLQVGDVLLKVNGVALDGDAGGQALLRVSRGTSATFEMRRQGKTSKVGMSARSLTTPPVTLSVVDGIGILRLRHFNVSGVAQQVHAAVASAQKQAVKGMMLDLRYNGGGRVEEYLLSAAAFTQPEPFFLKSRLDSAKISVNDGKYAVNDAVQSDLTLKNAARYSGPLVVLIDRDTASSAEFLARSLMNRPCTVVTGETTAGVGDTATRFIALPDGSGLQLTFAQMLDAQRQKLGERVEPQTQLDLRSATVAAAGKDTPLGEARGILNKLQQTCPAK